MKKIAIITLHGYFNFGNRLQNYALQETLKIFNYEVQTIPVDINSFVCKNNKISNKIARIKQMTIKMIIKKICGILRDFKNKKANFLRKELFIDFTKKNIAESDFVINSENLNDFFLRNFEFFVTGSDQVWNPNITFEASIAFFLLFSEKNKRIAYAPSFGVSVIPTKYKLKYQQWLNEITHLSIREELGANIIKELTGRNVPVLVDPTLLLTKEQWLSISKVHSEKPKQEYLISYFLGEKTKDAIKFIEKISKKYKLKIVNLAEIREKKYFFVGPSEFVDYLYSSKIIITDSFHGTVFSILFEKPFVVFDRVGTYSMNSRIDTLLSKFHLNSRKWDILDRDVEILSIDYSDAYPVLQTERKKAFDYLQSIFRDN